jgi:hypothetical protein
VIDHLTYGTPDLAATVADVGREWGVELTPGGQHIGLGTRNFLAGLGNGVYLEVIGPDLEQPAPEAGRPYGIDELAAPRLLTWVAQVSGLEDAVERARAAGYDPGPILSMSRRRPDGVLLEWQLTLPGQESEDGLVPFLIDWGDSPHPSSDAVGGLELVSLTGTHPAPDRVAAKLSALGQELVVTSGAPALRAVVGTPAGEVVLT